MYSPRLVAEARTRLEGSLGFPLRDYTLGEVEDFRSRMRDIEYDPDTGAPSRPFTPEEERYVVNELYLSRIDFRYWLTRYCLILTDDKRLKPLNPWPSQELLFREIARQEEEARETYRKIRIILLKSRQVGGTAGSEGLIAHMALLNPRTQALIASDHPDNSRNLWQVLLRMYDALPGWMRPHRDAKVKANNLHLDRLESDIVVGAGNQKTTLGQGMNLDAVHLTEVSTWEHPQYIDEDLMPAFDSSRKHHSIILFESTGSGAKGNWFHDQYQAAREGNSKFAPVFIAWYLRPGWSENPEGLEFSQDTLNMADRVKRESGYVLSREQLAWYQLKRRELESKDMLELFYQEFPSTIEEAFQTGLRSVFSIDLRTKIRDQIKKPIAVYDLIVERRKLRPVNTEEWVKSTEPWKADNRLVVWEWASPGYLYVVGVDASYGHTGGDSSAVQVLRVGNKWLPDEQVAEWRGTCSPMDLSTVVEMLGVIYKDKTDGLQAKVVIECNPGSPGIVTQTEMIRRGYPHFYIWRRPTSTRGGWTREYGWWTTPSTRPLMTEMGVDYIKKGWLKVNSQAFVEEMSSFVNTGIDRGKRHLEHAPGYTDDRIIALFIALYVAHDGEMVNMAEERRKWWEQKDQPTLKSKQFQSMGISWEEAIQKWEESLA